MLYCLMIQNVQQVKHDVLDTPALQSCTSPTSYCEILPPTTKAATQSSYACFAAAHKHQPYPCCCVPPVRRQCSSGPLSYICPLVSPLLCWERMQDVAQSMQSCSTEAVMSPSQTKARESHLWGCWYDRGNLLWKWDSDGWEVVQFFCSVGLIK